MNIFCLLGYNPVVLSDVFLSCEITILISYAIVFLQYHSLSILGLPRLLNFFCRNFAITNLQVSFFIPPEDGEYRNDVNLRAVYNKNVTRTKNTGSVTRRKLIGKTSIHSPPVLSFWVYFEYNIAPTQYHFYANLF